MGTTTRVLHSEWDQAGCFPFPEGEGPTWRWQTHLRHLPSCCPPRASSSNMPHSPCSVRFSSTLVSFLTESSQSPFLKPVPWDSFALGVCTIGKANTAPRITQHATPHHHVKAMIYIPKKRLLFFLESIMGGKKSWQRPNISPYIAALECPVIFVSLFTNLCYRWCEELWS